MWEDLQRKPWIEMTCDELCLAFGFRSHARKTYENRTGKEASLTDTRAHHLIIQLIQGPAESIGNNPSEIHKPWRIRKRSKPPEPRNSTPSIKTLLKDPESNRLQRLQYTNMSTDFLLAVLADTGLWPKLFRAWPLNFHSRISAMP